MNGCSRCNTEYTWRSYPRLLRGRKDELWAREHGKRVETVTLGLTEHAITWIERLYCDCAWKANLKGVDVQLLGYLLPDPWARQEQRRRAA